MMNELLKETISNLNKNNIKTFHVHSKSKVIDLIKEIVPKGSSVCAGGSMTLFECDIIDFLNNGDYKFYNRYKEGLTQDEIAKVMEKSHHCDYYFCSSNAVTKNGELYNVDGRSNRVAAIAHGPKNVIMVVSVDKIVEDLNAAIQRVKTIAAPKNCVRLNCNTYCKVKGECESIAKGKTQMTDGCSSIDRICCNYLVSAMQRQKDRIKIIFIGESCGY